MPYLPSKIRQILSDFAVLISILIASSIDALVGLNTQKLKVPNEFKVRHDLVVQNEMNEEKLMNFFVSFFMK